MTSTNMKATFSGNIQKIWEVVTTVENYSIWCSDLSKSERLDEKHFPMYRGAEQRDKSQFDAQNTVRVMQLNATSVCFF